MASERLEGACALLAWNGSAYGGWQLQPNAPTVQGEVERALARLMARDRVVVRAAGRLDAGVHAHAQVVGFAVAAPRTAKALFRGLNGLLPPDIACLALAPAVRDFDPRRVSRGKTYRYRFLVREARCPFRHREAWHIGRPLDLAAMHSAAQALVGRHDFTSFRASGCSAAHPLRRIRAIDIEHRGDEVHVVVDGEAFLRHQIRIIAGCLVEVGLRRKPAGWLRGVLDACDRTRAARTAPAHGLTLERVHFDPPLQWTEGGPPKPRWTPGSARETALVVPETVDANDVLH